MTNKSESTSIVEILGIPRRDEEYFNAEGIGAKAAIALAATLRTAGFITPDEYEALAISADLLAQQSENPLLIRVLILNGLLSPVSFDRSMTEMKQASRDQSEEIRKAVLGAAIPLLNCLGAAKRDELTSMWLSALGLSLQFTKPWQGLTTWTATLFSSLKNLTSGKHNIEKLIEYTEQIAETFKDEPLKKSVNALKKQQSQESISRVLTEIEAAAHRSLTAVGQLLPSPRIINEQEKQANRLLELTEILVEQIKNRLYYLRERLKVEHDNYCDDINTLIEAFLDNCEIRMRDLIAERKNWADKTLWNQFLQNDVYVKFKSTLRQHEDKYSKYAGIWEHELSSFSKEIEKIASVIRSGVDPIVFTGMVKTELGVVNLKNQLDNISHLTLGLHVTGAAITGILALINPAILAPLSVAVPYTIPVVLATAVPAILWKMFKNPEKRKRQVVYDERQKIRSWLISVIGDPIKKHEETCERILRQYLEVASKYYAPLVRDARLAVLQAKLEIKVVELIKNGTVKVFNECIDNFKAAKENLFESVYHKLSSIVKH